MIRVWDPVVRVFHWSLVAAFAIAFLSADEWDDVHIWAGYSVAALVAMRLIWGLVGSRYALFSQFLRGPAAVLSYLSQMRQGTEPRHLGHNPAGAAMIVALLLTLSVTASTGWLISDGTYSLGLGTVEQTNGDGGHRKKSKSATVELVKDLHELSANLMLILIAAHLGGVILASRRHHENLARSMLTGLKRKPAPGDIA